MGMRETVDAALRSRGVEQTARLLGLANETVLRLALGLPVHRGTEAMAIMNLARLSAGAGRGE